MLAHLGEQAVLNRDHNATSYSTETNQPIWNKEEESRRDHNATSYSTETDTQDAANERQAAEIITLRAIALKQIIPQSLILNIRTQRS